MSKAKKFDRAALITKTEAREELTRRNKENQLGIVYDSLYPWQRKFIDATRTHTKCLLMAANQCGKTRTGCCIDAYHLLGMYPEDWPGYIFDHPPNCWLLGYSGEKTRTLLQEKLFGRFNGQGFEGGYIPKDKILSWLPMTGTKHAMREVKVKHARGESTCNFWSYSGGDHALMGDTVSWVHCDEEPKDPAIWPQVVTRTLNGDRGKGGRCILTFTPEKGRTELVCQFMDDDVEDQYYQMASWDESPHFTEEKKISALAGFPPYQRDMRSKGIPLMGAGAIFELDEEVVVCDPRPIPPWWGVACAMDFGMNHPWALIRIAIDPENDIIYVTHEFKCKRLLPHMAWRATKSWAEHIPTAWPQDGLQTRESGKQKRDMYVEEGFNLMDNHATHEGGGVSVEAGLIQMNQLFEIGKLRIFSTCIELLEELRQYHTRTTRDGKVEIVKVKDDLTDALRYAIMMRREAETYSRLSIESDEDDSAPAFGYTDNHHDSRNACGY